MALNAIGEGSNGVRYEYLMVYLPEVNSESFLLFVTIQPDHRNLETTHAVVSARSSMAEEDLD